MKKRFTAILLSVAAALSCTAFSSCGETEKKSDGAAADGSWYEEKSGYKFCGYYQDEDFTQPVTVQVTKETADKYHAKYQPDKVQLYKEKPVDLERTVYATNFFDAIHVYLEETGGWVLCNSTAYGGVDYKALGVPFEPYQLYTGEAVGSFTMQDTCEYTTRYYAGGSIVEQINKRNNTWRACVYSPTHEQDGWQAFIVDDSFAVVVGMDAERAAEVTAETLEVPSKIGEYPVKEVSVIGSAYTLPTVKTLKIPSSVENVSILNAWYTLEEQVEKLEIAEGVKTVRLDTYLAQSVALPASAYYVDFHVLPSNGPRNIFYKDQTVTVADGGHYYAKNGCLYSKEGDLCYQFANRKSIRLQIDETAKRVLPLSVNGAAKNIYIPAGLEYFDLAFTDVSLRQSARLLEQPLLLISSDKVARQLVKEIAEDDESEIPPVLIANSLPLKKYKQIISEALLAAGAEGTEKFTYDFKPCTEGYSCLVVNGEYAVEDKVFLAKERGETPDLTYENCLFRKTEDTAGEAEWQLYTWLGEGELPEKFQELDSILSYFYRQEEAE